MQSSKNRLFNKRLVCDRQAANLSIARTSQVHRAAAADSDFRMSTAVVHFSQNSDSRNFPPTLGSTTWLHKLQVC